MSTFSLPELGLYAHGIHCLKAIASMVKYKNQ